MLAQNGNHAGYGFPHGSMSHDNTFSADSKGFHVVFKQLYTVAVALYCQVEEMH